MTTLRVGFAGLLLLAACGPPPDDAPVVTCSSDSRVEPYRAGMSASSGEVVVTLVQADPGPPAKGTNVWKMRATDSAGGALSGASLSVVPFMPDHGHGTSVTPQVEATGDGAWTVSQLYLFMPGVWRVVFTVTQPGKIADVAFFFCVAG